MVLTSMALVCRQHLLALILLAGPLVGCPVFAQTSPSSGSSLLNDEPAAVKLNDLERPSSDSSLLLDDRTDMTLDSILQKRFATVEKPVFISSPLEAVDGRLYNLVTASHLRAGELVQTQIVRLFKPQPGVNDDLFANQSNQSIYGLTDDIELTLDLQGVNGTVPGPQGPFIVERRVGVNNGNFFQDGTFQGKFKLGQLLGAQVSVVASVTTTRPQFSFYTLPADPAQPLARVLVESRPQDGITLVPALELPFTFKDGDERLAFTFAPKVAFFPSDNALFVPLNPGTNGSFGTTLGVGLGVAYKISPRIMVRADATPILTGNNTVNFISGLPSREIPFNLGVRYLVNPRLSLDIFVTNAYANSGAASLVTSSNTGVGVALALTPERTLYFLDFPANRKFAETFELGVPKAVRRQFVPASFDLLDGSTVPGGVTRANIQAATGAVSVVARSGALDDFETGTYANFAVDSGPDESDGGFSTKIRLLHQPSGDPLTLSTLFTIGRTSSRMCNFVDNDRNGLQQALNLQPTACPGVPGVAPAGDRGPIPPNIFGLVTENIGELIVLSLSFPTQYVLPEGHSFWVNPKIAYVQRGGDNTPLAGVSVGGALRVWQGLDLVAQLTPMLRGDNAFVGDTLQQRFPWQAGVRFTPGLSPAAGGTDLSFNVYATNAVGLSPYQSLRVRADNNLSVGLGVVLPF